MKIHRQKSPPQEVQLKTFHRTEESHRPSVVSTHMSARANYVRLSVRGKEPLRLRSAVEEKCRWTMPRSPPPVPYPRDGTATPLHRPPNASRDLRRRCIGQARRCLSPKFPNLAHRQTARVRPNLEALHRRRQSDRPPNGAASCLRNSILCK